MPDWIVWAIIGLVAVIVVAIVIYFIVKIIKMSPEERKELIITFLMGLVTAAEGAFESGKGEEKLKEVEDKFKSIAPWFLKLILKITKCGSLDDLVEEALKRAKETLWDKGKKQ